MRGANQSLVPEPEPESEAEPPPAAAAAPAAAAGDFLPVLGRVGSPDPDLRGPAGAEAEGAEGAAGAAGPAAAASAAPPSLSTGVRMTTGGMGREPGMLMRIRVVIVVSVFGSLGLAAGAGVPAEPGAAASSPWGDP
ncbi:hypothetical protein EKH77_20925 [Streptomyces luteoverticillatus]|uniref:Uncharacterized protein n=1 Tax=Streptomyces luteoverticillatus TaxID=66425 RepID=A0A3Q9FW29_STRLT|nr:hypothetical protein EKH77_20925 [Streptomyces luteoverticillatus]